MILEKRYESVAFFWFKLYGYQNLRSTREIIVESLVKFTNLLLDRGVIDLGFKDAT